MGLGSGLGAVSGGLGELWGGLGAHCRTSFSPPAREGQAWTDGGSGPKRPAAEV